MCSALDQGAYEVRFERKKCGLFRFCLIFLSFCIVASCLISKIHNSTGSEAYRCHPTSEIRYSTFDIRHPRFDILHLISEIRYPTSEIRHPRFGIRHLISEMRHPTSDIRDLTSDTRHPTSEIRHPTSEIPHPTFERMAVMCSSWDQGAYEVRFERKQFGLFWFCLMFLSFCIVSNAYYPGVLLN